MKTDLATAIIVGIIGVVISYFMLSSFILKDPESVTIKSLESATSVELKEPSNEIFNYRAINPTVETYVDCANYDSTGSCLNEEQ